MDFRCATVLAGVVGLITDRALLMAWETSGARSAGSVTAGSLVDGNQVTVSPDEDAAWALELMSAYRVRRLPVVENGRLVGIITQADLARTMPVADMVGCCSIWRPRKGRSSAG